MRAIIITVTCLILTAYGGGSMPIRPRRPNPPSLISHRRPRHRRMEAILEDAVERTGLSRVQLKVERAEAVNWSDGSLGCSQPGEFYKQALVDGYWVALSGPDVWLDYRVDDSGHFKLCEGDETPHSSGSTSPDVTIGPPGAAPTLDEGGRRSGAPHSVLSRLLRG